MARAFADISFTPSVKAAQEFYGSRSQNEFFEQAEDARNTLTDAEVQFIQARDSFYQATVAQNGWPYVQHRGGPAGFLKVLDERTIGFADLSGNRQYLSVGNINQDGRISLILMDYAHKRRLKIWGRARIVHEQQAPELIAQLEVSTYRARVERGIVITVEALEWNCPQHITARFTQAQIEQVLAPLIAENTELKKQLEHSSKPSAPHELGSGNLRLVITGIRQLTPRVRAYELRAANELHAADELRAANELHAVDELRAADEIPAADRLRAPNGTSLPQVQAGAHLQLPVILNNGQSAHRHYSISSNPQRRDCYEIAVLAEPAGQGGSLFIHQHYQLGTIINTQQPDNYFALDDKPTAKILIAAGIGITPIKAMAQALKHQGVPFALHYAGKSPGEMAYLDRLQKEFGAQLAVYCSQQGPRLNVRHILQATPQADFYICGPQSLITEFYQQAAHLGVDASRLHSELFSTEKSIGEKPVQLTLARSNKIIQVQQDQSLLTAIEQAGVAINSSCRTGACGACVVQVLEGEVDHRDKVLTAQEKSADLMCVCVSRAHTPALILDI